jgi:hypothetical protein
MRIHRLVIENTVSAVGRQEIVQGHVQESRYAVRSAQAHVTSALDRWDIRLMDADQQGQVTLGHASCLANGLDLFAEENSRLITSPLAVSGLWRSLSLRRRGHTYGPLVSAIAGSGCMSLKFLHY